MLPLQGVVVTQLGLSCIAGARRVRTRTLVLQTPNTKRSPPELSLKSRLVPSGVPLCEDPSIPAKNRGESSEDTRIVRFI